MVIDREKKRLEFHEILRNILRSDQVYFQAPKNIHITYPAIIYTRGREEIVYADDGRYLTRNRYIVTVIDEDPMSELFDKIADLPYCSHDRFYVADNLNHDVFNIFY